jgi:hypothetical protein
VIVGMCERVGELGFGVVLSKKCGWVHVQHQAASRTLGTGTRCVPGAWLPWRVVAPGCLS